MIKNVKLLYSTCLLLKNTFGYKIDIEDNEEDVKVPTFFVSVSPLTTDSFLRYNKKLTNIVITYVDKVITQEKLLDMQDQLDNLFDIYLEVEKRKIVLDKKKFNRTKDFLTLTLTLNYLDDKANVPSDETYTKLMEILKLTTKKG